MNTQNTQILKAVLFAIEAHAGQVRSGNGEPHHMHVLRVAARVTEFTTDDDIIVAAVLHDTAEDTGESPDAVRIEIAQRFGDRVSGLVAENTDDQTISSRERKRQQVILMPTKSPGAQLIKVADACDNGESILDNPPDWRPGSIVAYMKTKDEMVTAATDIPPALREIWDGIYARVRTKYAVETS